MESGIFMSLFLLLCLIMAPLRALALDASMLSGESPEYFHLAFEHQATSKPTPSLGVTIEEQKGVLTLPLFKVRRSAFALIASGTRTELGESLRFADRGIDIPKEFQSTEAGIMWTKKEEDGDRYGASASYGRAGTGFWSKDGSGILNFTAFTERPTENGNSWFFFLNYANNRTFLNNIPLPGFAYSMRRGSYRLLLGVPFALFFWRPSNFSLMVVGSPFSASFELGYRIWGPVQAYGNAAWLPKAYQNLVPGTEERLISEGKEAGAGLRFFLTRKASLSAGYVRAFDRELRLGTSRSKTTSTPVKLGNADGFQAKIAFGF